MVFAHNSTDASTYVEHFQKGPLFKGGINIKYSTVLYITSLKRLVPLSKRMHTCKFNTFLMDAYETHNAHVQIQHFSNG